MDDRKWYQLSVGEVMAILGTTGDGLTEARARELLARYGPNELKLKTRGPLVRFLLQFHNPLLYVLMIAAGIAFLLGKTLDAWVILAVVLATAIIGFVQEGKAEGAIGALRRMLVPQCDVVRAGERRTVATRNLVPGDVVLLEAGDRVPADLRLYQGKNFAVDEAVLTGESVPVSKQYEPLADPGLTPAEQKNMAFSGTFVATGVARGIVVETGPRTEIGKISRIITEMPKSAPPILRKIGEFTKLIMIGILILSAVNFVLGWSLGYEAGFTFLASVSMIVAMVPEGLPAALIGAFSLGVTTMARRNALIRRLPAVETLGCATVICSDKTGTLTKNQMTVRQVYCGGRHYQVTGAGYDPRGKFVDQAEDRVLEAVADGCPDLHQVLRAGLLCNNASLVRNQDGRYEINGDPTEGALLVAARKAGLDGGEERLDEIPFDSQVQYMATLHRGSDHNLIYVKGAPEKVLGMCTDQLVGGQQTALDREEIMAVADDMAAGAMRVLGFAQKKVPVEQAALTGNDLADMTFLGLQGMLDPPREEAVEAVRHCARAGIRVVMITGDHARTAKAIANQTHIGLGEERVLTGRELEAMTDDELYAAVDSVSVYARTTPEHKYRIVRQLRRHGHVVAVTGDGVNDAPALSIADIGIAMGITGTQVTKEAADMILADDNFASIVKAVEEGRHIFNNIWKVILFLLPTNGGQGLVMLGAVMLAPLVSVFAERLPVEPVQILWVNLIISVGCAIPLTREPREPGLLDRQPRNPAEKLVNPMFIWKVTIVSVVSAAAVFTMFLLYVDTAGPVTERVLVEAQTVAFTTIICVQLAYLFTARRTIASAFTFSPFSNRWLLLGAGTTLGLQLAIVYAEPLFGVSPFRTAPFPVEWWAYIAAAATPGFLAIELEKLVRRRLQAKSALIPNGPINSTNKTGNKVHNKKN
jgi:magnesium-transporting ATPase (P-type)